jgi:ribulose-5-phosphate 4-epimerase/fuculose-1-phosphate aldolase
MAKTGAVKKLAAVRQSVSPEEWQARVDLAACYRLAHHYGMTDLIYTHISARVPGPEEHFLINPYGLLFSEVTASSLIKIDLDGETILNPDPRYSTNYAGFVIHSAVHRARPDVGCVMHTHSRAGMAISALECGLLPITQTAMRFYNRIGYHDYEGPALDLDEQKRLAADLGTRNAMILRNHGFLVAGTSVAEAFNIMHWLERAAQAQLDIMACNAKFTVPPPELAEKTAHLFDPGVRRRYGEMEWPTMLRFLDGVDGSYKE